jgi:hypothetical protein
VPRPVTAIGELVDRGWLIGVPQAKWMSRRELAKLRALIGKAKKQGP